MSISVVPGVTIDDCLLITVEPSKADAELGREHELYLAVKMVQMATLLQTHGHARALMHLPPVRSLASLDDIQISDRAYDGVVQNS